MCQAQMPKNDSMVYSPVTQPVSYSFLNHITLYQQWTSYSMIHTLLKALLRFWEKTCLSSFCHWVSKPYHHISFHFTARFWHHDVVKPFCTSKNFFWNCIPKLFKSPLVAWWEQSHQVFKTIVLHTHSIKVMWTRHLLLQMTFCYFISVTRTNTPFLPTFSN